MKKKRKFRNKRKGKKILINMIILITTFFVLFLISEIFLRNLSVYTIFERDDHLSKFIQVSDNPRLNYELKPNSKGYIYDKEVIINRKGERGGSSLFVQETQRHDKAGFHWRFNYIWFWKLNK